MKYAPELTENEIIDLSGQVTRALESGDYYNAADTFKHSDLSPVQAALIMVAVARNIDDDAILREFQATLNQVQD